MNIQEQKDSSSKSYGDIAKTCGLDRGYVCRGVKNPARVSYKAFMSIAAEFGIRDEDATEIWKASKKLRAEELAAVRMEKAISK